MSEQDLSNAEASASSESEGLLKTPELERGAERFPAICFHCEKEFMGFDPESRLCMVCFIAGHRGSQCDQYCKATPDSTMMAAHFAQRAQATETGVAPAISADTPESISQPDPERLTTRAELMKAIGGDTVPRDIADEMYEALKGLTEVAYRHSWAHIENVDDGECGCKECRVKYARAAIKKYEDSKK